MWRITQYNLPPYVSAADRSRRPFLISAWVVANAKNCSCTGSFLDRRIEAGWRCLMVASTFQLRLYLLCIMRLALLKWGLDRAFLLCMMEQSGGKEEDACMNMKANLEKKGTMSSHVNKVRWYTRSYVTFIHIPFLSHIPLLPSYTSLWRAIVVVHIAQGLTVLYKFTTTVAIVVESIVNLRFSSVSQILSFATVSNFIALSL